MFPALLYPVKCKESLSTSFGSPGVMTRLQMHRLAIFPQMAADKFKELKGDSNTVKSTEDSGDALTPLPKKYTWYPNNNI